ncbi:putative adenylate/guanylate cyclase [[Leptolyngbya] sp. PCC 7376]|uniref:adenylate/guanylate cyclase domain-containing protein n=1 Tax=[Leptolyngbya] sp. PCC 7376 TaxID=111781 RepID=UPI00029F1225|nr:adenylate/guanylate cyclase domain-containing protein [[Leptolyngbya] sp. PCC 7376]AFY39351.1 putative adenylate/guanylate cyclase [[Leptolyngbya] sp. PCC 7376]
MPETPEHLSNQPDKLQLKQLLSERNQYPDRTEKIDEKIWELFGREVAILVLDMSGFSRISAKYGIIHFLAMIHQMEQASCPAVIENGGQVIKQEADNLFAIFPHPTRALEAALDICRAFDAMNDVSPEERHVYGCIGIGYGKTLIIDEKDLFGAEMNITCKLGEDLAEKKEILITADAYRALPNDRYACTPKSFSISGMDLQGYRFQECLYPNIKAE